MKATWFLNISLCGCADPDKSKLADSFGKYTAAVREAVFPPDYEPDAALKRKPVRIHIKGDIAWREDFFLKGWVVICWCLCTHAFFVKATTKTPAPKRAKTSASAVAGARDDEDGAPITLEDVKQKYQAGQVWKGRYGKRKESVG